jgi:hypothetical protein
MEEKNSLPSCKEVFENKVSDLRAEGFGLEVSFRKACEWFGEVHGMSSPYTWHTFGYQLYYKKRGGRKS